MSGMMRSSSFDIRSLMASFFFFMRWTCSRSQPVALQVQLDEQPVEIRYFGSRKVSTAFAFTGGIAGDHRRVRAC